jgi:ribosomal-protein-alanine N-acetyltransferase
VATRKPARIETARLVLRRPRARDAQAIYRRYSGDAEVTRYLGWPRHRKVGQTRAFLDFSDADWRRWPAGPFLIESRETGELLGGTGLAFETPFRASTGYVLARDAWGLGYATEALRAMVELAGRLGVRRLYALCHPDHAPSRHVLEKCGFAREALLRRHSEFPNLRAGEPADTLLYARVFEQAAAAGM